MARFDVYRLASGSLVLDCQADILSSLKTRFVVPLLPVEEAPHPAARLNPIFSFGGESHVMVTQFAAAMPLKEVTEAIASLEAEEVAISNALDMLLTGY